MNRRTLIVVIFSMLFVLQAALLFSWHLTSDKPMQASDIAVSVLTLCLTAIIYVASTRFYFMAIKRSTEAHVAREGAELEHSLELYRSIALREEQLARKVEIPEMVKMMKRVVPEFISNNSKFSVYDAK